MGENDGLRIVVVLCRRTGSSIGVKGISSRRGVDGCKSGCERALTLIRGAEGATCSRAAVCAHSTTTGGGCRCFAVSCIAMQSLCIRHHRRCRAPVASTLSFSFVYRVGVYAVAVHVTVMIAGSERHLPVHTFARTVPRQVARRWIRIVLSYSIALFDFCARQWTLAAMSVVLAVLAMC